MALRRASRLPNLRCQQLLGLLPFSEQAFESGYDLTPPSPASHPRCRLAAPLRLAWSHQQNACYGPAAATASQQQLHVPADSQAVGGSHEVTREAPSVPYVLNVHTGNMRGAGRSYADNPSFAAPVSLLA